MRVLVRPILRQERIALLFRRPGAINQFLFLLPFGQNEMIVLAVSAPGTRWDFSNFDKLPIRHIGRLQAKIITNCR